MTERGVFGDRGGEGNSPMLSLCFNAGVLLVKLRAAIAGMGCRIAAARAAVRMDVESIRDAIVVLVCLVV